MDCEWVNYIYLIDNRESLEFTIHYSVLLKNMDHFHLARVFVAVANAHSFAAAARQLKLSAPAVTRCINELERHLGLRLLVRTTRTVRVTEAGERYAQDCRRILAELQEAQESVSGLHGAPRGRLTLTAPVLFGAYFVTPLLTQYLQRYPEVSASCLFLDRVVNLVDEGVDVAIRIGALPDSSLQAIRVGQVRRVIVGAPHYLEQSGTPQQPEDLHAHTIISANSVTPQAEWRLVEHGQVRTLRLHPRLMTTTNDSAIQAAERGFGLTRLLSYQVAQALQQGRLQTVLSGFEPEPLPIHVVHREGRQPPQRVRAFIDMAVDHLRKQLEP